MSKRIYIVTKRIQDTDKFLFCGAYTNRKILLEHLNMVVNINDVYIKGVRKNKLVNDVNLNIELQKPIKLNIYNNEDQIEIQINTYNLNSTNPDLIQSNK